jgi:hypothetical protein
MNLNYQLNFSLIETFFNFVLELAQESEQSTTSIPIILIGTTALVCSVVGIYLVVKKSKLPAEDRYYFIRLEQNLKIKDCVRYIKKNLNCGQLIDFIVILQKGSELIYFHSYLNFFFMRVITQFWSDRLKQHSFLTEEEALHKLAINCSLKTITDVMTEDDNSEDVIFSSPQLRLKFIEKAGPMAKRVYNGLNLAERYDCPQS